MPTYTIRIKDETGTRLYHYNFDGTPYAAIRYADQLALSHTRTLLAGETIQALVLDTAAADAGHSGLIWEATYCDPSTARILSETTAEEPNAKKTPPPHHT